MNQKLLPCPFCGSDAQSIIKPSGAVVSCSNGNCDVFFTYFTAAEWNTRANHIVDANKMVDVEAVIKACVPGGDICDPQIVADNLREYFKNHVADSRTMAEPSSYPTVEEFVADCPPSAVVAYIKKLQGDAKRLDWLNASGRVARFSDGWTAWEKSDRNPANRIYADRDIRQAIDAAMKGDAK